MSLFLSVWTCFYVRSHIRPQSMHIHWQFYIRTCLDGCSWAEMRCRFQAILVHVQFPVHDPYSMDGRSIALSFKNWPEIQCIRIFLLNVSEFSLSNSYLLFRTDVNEKLQEFWRFWGWFLCYTWEDLNRKFLIILKTISERILYRKSEEIFDG